MATFPSTGPDPAVYWPGVSVIVAARDAAATLGGCLASLKALDYESVEIIVVDDGSRDETKNIAIAAGVRVLVSPVPGPAAARNFGVAHASNEIVAFTDSDCTVPAHWLRSLVSGLRESRAAGAGGPQRNVFPETAGADARDLDSFFSLAGVLAEYTRTDEHAHDVDHNASCNVAYIRHAFTEAGGFAEDLFPGEDVDLDFKLQKLGYRCYYVPDAFVHHERPGTREWFAGMMRRYGRAQRTLVERHGRFRALHYVPLVLVALASVQLLIFTRRTRPLGLAVDSLLLAGVVALLWQRVPLNRWPAVVRLGLVAMKEWNLGYAEGLNPDSRRATATVGVPGPGHAEPRVFGGDVRP